MYRTLFMALSLWLALHFPGPQAYAGSSDPREAFQPGLSPAWLVAVGRLKVPGIRVIEGRRRHHTERCSGTLVKSPGDRRARIVVTAWHCLEFYEDLSRGITFSLMDSNGQWLEVQARRLSSGGSMAADWALMQLHRALDEDEATALVIDPAPRPAPTGLMMAGYSRDAGLGEEGRRLTFDPHCEITGANSSTNHFSSNCRAYKGASGGAVIARSPQGEPQLTGVISQGDGADISEFVTVERFRRELQRHLKISGA